MGTHTRHCLQSCHGRLGRARAPLEASGALVLRLATVLALPVAPVLAQPAGGSSAAEPPASVLEIVSGPAVVLEGIAAGALASLVLAAALLAACTFWRRRQEACIFAGDLEQPKLSPAESSCNSVGGAGSIRDAVKASSLPIPASPFLQMAQKAYRSSDSKPLDLLDSDPLLDIFTSSKLQASSSNTAAGSSVLGPDASSSIIGAPLCLPQSPAAASPRCGGYLSTNMDLWHIDFRELRILHQIGAGSYGRVYVAQYRQRQVAAKLLLGHMEALDNVEAAADLAQSLSPSPVATALEQEASLMSALNHPHILKFVGLCTQPPCLVSEYCPRGSLFDTLREAQNSPALARALKWHNRLKMALGAALGMHYLHSFKPPLVHRDLKSPNMLIGPSWTVKVCDFNLSVLSESCVENSSAAPVTNPRWLAPEVLTTGSHSFASDVFSFGVVLWELLTFRSPWEGFPNPWQVAMNVISGRRLQVPEDLGKLPGGTFAGMAKYIELMEQCWAHDPAQRPSFATIIIELKDLMRDEVRANVECRRANEEALRRSSPPAPPTPAAKGVRVALGAHLLANSRI